MCNKIICFHHNDRDGLVSAAIVKHWFISEYDTEGYTFIPIGVNYTYPLEDYLKPYNPEEIETIYIVDYSLSTVADIAFADKYKDKVVWIDHHLSSIQNQNTYEGLKEIRGWRVNGMSAALLCDIYFWAIVFGEGGGPNTVKLIKWAKSSTETPIDKDLIKKCVDENGISRFVYYTHRYDTWDIDDNVTYFSIGEREKDIDKLMDKIYDDDEVDKAIEEGKIIYKYLIDSYETHINEYGVHFDINVSGKTYSALLVNMIQPNSLKFGIFYDIVDILVPFFYTGKGYRYSMYAKREDIDCAEICKCFGGGGHKQAAGFYIPRNEIQLRPKSGETVYIKNKSICGGE